jgi:hypothetical protein
MTGRRSDETLSDKFPFLGTSDWRHFHEEIRMNVRDQLLASGIVVPPDTLNCRTGRGCILFTPGPAQGPDDAHQIPLDRQQYEALMCAGLAGPRGFRLDDPYCAPGRAQNGYRGTHANA